MPTPNLALGRALESLCQLDGVASPVRDEDGTVHVAIACSMARVEDVLACLPGSFELVHERFTELFDESGDGVDYESEEGIYASPDTYTTFAYMDHWQAGLHGEVVVSRSEEDFRTLLEELLLQAREETPLDGEA